MNGKAKRTLIIADDHRMVAEGFVQLLEARYTLLAVVSDGPALVEAATRRTADAIIVDVGLPGISGIEAIRRLRVAGVSTPALIVSVDASPANVAAAMKAGANGFLHKAATSRALIEAIEAVIAGRGQVGVGLATRPPPEGVPAMTPRQAQVLDLIATGLRSREIAAKLCISARTVEVHRHALLSKFGVSSSLAMILKARQMGVLD